MKNRSNSNGIRFKTFFFWTVLDFLNPWSKCTVKSANSRCSGCSQVQWTEPSVRFLASLV